MLSKAIKALEKETDNKYSNEVEGKQKRTKNKRSATSSGSTKVPITSSATGKEMCFQCGLCVHRSSQCDITRNKSIAIDSL